MILSMRCDKWDAINANNFTQFNKLCNTIFFVQSNTLKSFYYCFVFKKEIKLQMYIQISDSLKQVEYERYWYTLNQYE